MIRTWLSNIVYVSLFSMFVEILIVDGTTKKFVKLIMGFLIVIVIISPFSKIIFGKETFDIKILNEDLVIENATLERRKEIENSYQDIVLKEYENNIKRHMEDLINLRFSDIKLEDINMFVDMTSGEILDLSITYSKKVSPESSNISEIEKINIQVGETKSEIKLDEELLIENQIKDLLEANYTVERKNIKLYLR